MSKRTKRSSAEPSQESQEDVAAPKPDALREAARLACWQAGRIWLSIEGRAQKGRYYDDGGDGTELWFHDAEFLGMYISDAISACNALIADFADAGTPPLEIKLDGEFEASVRLPGEGELMTDGERIQYRRLSAIWSQFLASVDRIAALLQ
ncbi:MAG: hypothetical protein GC190_19295 [Alphaproteobacteria bacterium]|nr:hypothetical protein [Alphaproteobacteria bacterium]